MVKVLRAPGDWDQRINVLKVRTLKTQRRPVPTLFLGVGWRTQELGQARTQQYPSTYWPVL